MFPSPQTIPGEGIKLEDRLRGLILNNANGSGAPNGRPPPPTTAQSGLSRPGFGGQRAQQAFAPQVSSQDGVDEPSSAGLASQGRKRPNQAQRRQLNSQLSIPINPRPNTRTQAGRGPGYGPPQGQLRQQQHQNYSGQQPMPPNPRYQQYSPRFQNPASPYSPRSFNSQPSPQSPMPNYQGGPSPPFQARQVPTQYQHPNNGSNYPRPPPSRPLYNSGPQNNRGQYRANPEEIMLQGIYLQDLVNLHVRNIGVDPEEEAEKEAFRAKVEELCKEAIADYEKGELENETFDSSTVRLECFGSMKSGFATKASDMDLALLTPSSSPAPDAPESAIPRVLERKLLDHGYGARLLTRTRVPIIKLCQKPTTKLLADLLEARAKWESGFAGDGDEEEEDERVTVKIQVEKIKKHKSDSQVSPTNATHSEVVEEVSYEQKLANLKQKDGQSLGDYYSSAKRLLRKLGSRDITHNAPDLDEEEGQILNDVCRAFISGLRSEQLSTSLQKYLTIAPLFDPSLPFLQRTLHGVWTQIEGERLAMVWESRPLVEGNQKHEFDSSIVVQGWRELQDKQGAVTESLFFNRQLSQASDKLKKISSLQLVSLEQIQGEDPLYYYERTKRIMVDLLGRDPQYAGSTEAIIVSHYIAGINDQSMREKLEHEDLGMAGLEQVGLYHRALQLANDYEFAMKSSLFDEADHPDIEKFVTLLRSLKYNSRNEEDAVLIAKMRTLTDPTLTSPNKPRNRWRDHLEFPNTDIGIQCDINFNAHLAIHNTQLLRCYSQSDSRVRQIVLFIKHWAKVRDINTPYRGTLSSYGYVLMVLHYLVNVAQPYVCQNLQIVNNEPPPHLSPAEKEALSTCNGRNVKFWRNETYIKSLADKGMMNHNHDSVGTLLRGFFEYYAQSNMMTSTPMRGFDWGVEVLSLRTPGGILSKQEKGWVGAKTVIETSRIAAPLTPSTPLPPLPTDPTPLPPAASDALTPPATDAPPKNPKLAPKTVEETKEIRHRYLLAIEDPFELDHNVARTVTHDGICRIRDELRSAWKIISSVGRTNNLVQFGGLLDKIPEKTEAGGMKEIVRLLFDSPRASADGTVPDHGWA